MTGVCSDCIHSDNKHGFKPVCNDCRKPEDDPDGLDDYFIPRGALMINDEKPGSKR